MVSILEKSVVCTEKRHRIRRKDKYRKDRAVGKEEEERKKGVRKQPQKRGGVTGSNYGTA